MLPVATLHQPTIDTNHQAECCQWQHPSVMGPHHSSVRGFELSTSRVFPLESLCSIAVHNSHQPGCRCRRLAHCCHWQHFTAVRPSRVVPLETPDSDAARITHRYRRQVEWFHRNHLTVMRAASLTGIDTGAGGQLSGSTGTIWQCCGPHHPPT